MISEKEIKEIADMSKLKVSKDEIKRVQKDFNEFIDLIKIMDDEKNSHKKGDMLGVNDKIIELREDLVVDGLSQEEVIKNTLESQYGYFKLLKIVD